MRTTIIMTMMDIAAAAVRTMTMKTMIMRSMSIIITTITMVNAAARIMTMSTTITIMRSMSIIITTTMMVSAAAAVTTTSITIIMLMRYFPAGLETIDAVNKEQLTAILEELAYGNEYGDVLRAKGMLPSEKEGEWYYFDMVPEQYEIRTGAPDYTGKVCVIGANLKEVELKKAFGRN